MEMVSEFSVKILLNDYHYQSLYLYKRSIITA